MQHNIFFTSILVVLSVLVFAGCKNPDARFVKVEGTIKYNGEAIEGADVTFVPVDSSGEAASGRTDANGKYTLTTAGAQKAGAGAVPAEYTVLVSKNETTQITDPDELAEQRGDITYDQLQERLTAKGGSTTQITHKALIPAKYSNPGMALLKATVTKGKTDPIDFELTD